MGGGIRIDGGSGGGKGVDVAMVDNICGSATLAADSTFGA